MALFPSEADATGFVNLSEISTWVGLSDAAFNAFQQVVGEMQPNHIRMAVESSRVPTRGDDSRPLSVVECSQVGLVWRIAKRISQCAAGTAYGDIDVEDPLIVPDKREPPSEEPGVSSGSGHAQKKYRYALGGRNAGTGNVCSSDAALPGRTMLPPLVI
eukprot:6467921-Amphidinium_carterae.1